MDLEKFFDWVDYDILMLKLVYLIEDKWLLKFICCFFEVEMMVNGQWVMWDRGML